LFLAFYDVQSIRLLTTDERNPLPGFPIIALETAWQCHYVAFANDEAREAFREQVEALIPKRSGKSLQRRNQRWAGKCFAEWPVTDWFFLCNS